jgi:integrase/recombinase XerD
MGYFFATMNHENLPVFRPLAAPVTLAPASSDAPAPARRLIGATSDEAAIWTWLEEFNDSSSTFRAYRKEAERFYNWLRIARQKALNEVVREDFSAYEAFMTDPQPHHLWCAPRSHRRIGGDGPTKWRPFEGALSPRSRAHALTVLGSLFVFLVDAGYLGANPLSLRRRKKRDIDTTDDSAPKHIPLPILQKMLTVLTQRCNEAAALPPTDRHARERMLFVSRILANTGLRREELGAARMSDIFMERNPRTGQDCWYMRVVGKGKKARTIAFNDAARHACQRYRLACGADTHYRGNARHVLIPLRYNPKSQTKPMTGQSVYVIVKDALEIAASTLTASSDADAELLRAATPHWFRHTFATIALNAGHPLKLVQAQLGHESIETTAIYQHAELFAMFETFDTISL